MCSPSTAEGSVRAHICSTKDPSPNRPRAGSGTISLTFIVLIIPKFTAVDKAVRDFPFVLGAATYV